MKQDVNDKNNAIQIYKCGTSYADDTDNTTLNN